MVLKGLQEFQVRIYVKPRDASEWRWVEEDIEAPTALEAAETIRDMFTHAGHEVDPSYVVCIAKS